jgi:hypothetical protein
MLYRYFTSAIFVILSFSKLQGQQSIYTQNPNETVLQINAVLIKKKIGDKWQLNHQTNDEFKPVCYDSIGEFTDLFARVKLNNKYGFIDYWGKSVTEIKYDELGQEFLWWTVPFRIGNYWGYINGYGKEITACEYDTAFEFTEDKGIVKKNGKWGVVNFDGTPLTKFEYDKMQNFSSGFASAKIGNCWGTIDKSGKVILPFIYDYIFDFVKHKSIAFLNGKRVSVALK